MSDYHQNTPVPPPLADDAPERLQMIRSSFAINFNLVQNAKDRILSAATDAGRDEAINACIASMVRRSSLPRLSLFTQHPDSFSDTP